MSEEIEEWDGLKPDASSGMVADPPAEYLEHRETTGLVIGAAFEVYNTFGYGFLERVYQRAMQVELRKRGVTAELESKIQVIYKGVVVGDYQADILFNGSVVVELKVSKIYQSDDEPQLLNELKATRLPVGLLINFGRREVTCRRLVLTPTPPPSCPLVPSTSEFQFPFSLIRVQSAFHLRLNS